MRFVELLEIPAGTCLPNIRLYTTTTKSGGWGYGAQRVALVHNPHSRTHANASDTLREKKQTETYLRNRQPQRKKNRFLITAQFARIAPSAFATRNTHTRADIHTSVHTYIHT